MKRRLWIGVTVGLMVAAMFRAEAAIMLVDNLSGDYYPGLILDDTHPVAQTFNSGTAEILTEVRVILYRGSETTAGNYSIDLYAVNPTTHVPTGLLANLGGGRSADLDTANTSYVTLSGLSIGLSANTDYAIYVSIDTDISQYIRVGRQSWSDTLTPPDGFFGVPTWQTSFASGNPGSPTANSYPLRMQIQGQILAVPEPNQFVAVGMVVVLSAGEFGLRRKRGRSPAA